ncbi:MAG: hypothetical protein IK099_13515 [Clostridia bacterium]|nr:hypothetical protein [Clostridia bacterium]
MQDRIVSASEACSILDCSRQNIDDLMRRDKLHPIRTDAKYKLFSKRKRVYARNSHLHEFELGFEDANLYACPMNKLSILVGHYEGGSLFAGQAYTTGGR